MADQETRGCVGWSVQVWNGDGEGFRISHDEITATIELDCLLLRDIAKERGLEKKMEHLPRWDDSKKKRSGDDVLVQFVGLFDATALREFLRKAACLMEGIE